MWPGKLFFMARQRTRRSSIFPLRSLGAAASSAVCLSEQRTWPSPCLTPRSWRLDAAVLGGSPWSLVAYEGEYLHSAIGRMQTNIAGTCTHLHSRNTSRQCSPAFKTEQVLCFHVQLDPWIGLAKSGCDSNISAAGVLPRSARSLTWLYPCPLPSVRSFSRFLDLDASKRWHDS